MGMGGDGTELQLLRLKKTMSGLPISLEAESIEWWFSIGRSCEKMLMLKVIDGARKDVTQNSEVGKCNNRCKVQMIESRITFSQWLSGSSLGDIFS